jgi:hypothetical protein
MLFWNVYRDPGDILSGKVDDGSLKCFTQCGRDLEAGQIKMSKMRNLHFKIRKKFGKAIFTVKTPALLSC